MSNTNLVPESHSAALLSEKLVSSERFSHSPDTVSVKYSDISAKLFFVPRDRK